MPSRYSLLCATHFAQCLYHSSNTESPSKVLRHSAILHVWLAYTVALKLCAHVSEDIPSAHVKFRSNWLKIMWRGKNYDGGNTDNCAQGQTTKCYLVLDARKCFVL